MVSVAEQEEQESKKAEPQRHMSLHFGWTTLNPNQKKVRLDFSGNPRAVTS